MYAKLQDLMGRKDRPRLHKFVQNVNIEELCKVLSDKIYSADIVKVLDEILQAFCNADKFSENKLKVVKAILKTLGSAKINSNHAEEIISLIAMDFPNFSKNCLIQLVQFSTSNIYSNEDNFYSWKDLLPVLLEILEQEKYIDYMNSEVTGSEYKTLIVKSICNSHWEPSIVPCLAKMFGDMILEKKDLNVVIIALCHKLCMIALNEIPPFVYQTLRLCSNSSCIHLIVSLRKYFASYYSNANSKEKENNLDDISTTSLKEIQDAESNVLFHIHHATQLHYKCIKDLILAFKKFSIVPEYILEPFILSTIFIISSVHEEQVFEMLHQTILRKMQDDEKCKNSAWLNSLMNNNCDIMNIIDQVIANSDKDRHVVLKGIMELGFVLMDTEHTIGKVNKYPIHNIGIQILQRLMKKRHEICGSVLQLLTDKIVAGGLLISQYTDCLAYMCSKLAMNVLDFQTYIITLLDQLLCVPGTAAVQILYAVLPLIHVSSNIKDNLMLSLRKALYRKGICTRKMAVTGFLELLKMLKMNSRRNLSNDCSRNSSMSITLSNSTSILTQVTLEKHNNIGNNYGCNKRLCVDILNILKKCFTQEYEVRSHLYEGLYEVVIKNPELSEYIVEILLAQLNLYYEIDENVLPPLKIDLSADINDIQIVPKEPIATLISVLQAIYIKTALEDWEILNKVAIILESLCIRMIRTETEHLNLDDIMNLLDNTPKSQQKLHNLKEMIGVYESLISFRVNSWVNESKNIAKSIYGLFKGYNRLMDIIKIFEWISKCSQTEGISVSTAILILQILLWIEDCDKDNGEILNDICLEISEKLGMIHKIETSKNEKYKIINENTVVQAYSVLNHYIKNKLDNVSWFLERLKAELAIMNVVNINNEQHAEDLVEKERNLCRQLSYIIQILYTLANISIDPGQSTNSIFKNLQQLYNILSKLTKYFYNKSSSGNAAFHAVRFIQVIQLAGKPLKSTFYNLVTHIEESQSKDKKRLKTDTNIQKNHILKETKLIPRVVYEIEQFSKEVLLLAKKTGVPLENYIKHSVTRDFRILDSRLTESLEQIDVSMLSTQRTNVTNINNSLTHDLDNNSSSITEHSLTES
ncbi:Fanconi anemia group I protein homolog isoform X4 [Vespa crabro]|uniref:Fanconi anemia group I protein homolog isoform X4 n=1 Tax=Vespa crabro TaxID=7445 RepID=UPI001F0016AE|nr:Fanconi anemia group I protein homolog isoform X4 [Vespa crabro]XP_046836218.1 Fanconi anemia group I protein homolog isoform X4 [Vespa crabro]